MGQPVVRVLLDEVPNFLVRAILHGKASLFVLNLAGFKRIVSLLLLLFFVVAFLLGILLLRKEHSSSLTLLQLVLLDALVDALDVQHA